MTARLAFPSCGGALTATRYSVALSCMTLSFIACGLTATEMVTGISLEFQSLAASGNNRESLPVNAIDESRLLDLVNQTKVPMVLLRKSLGLRIVLRHEVQQEPHRFGLRPQFPFNPARDFVIEV